MAIICLMLVDYSGVCSKPLMLGANVVDKMKRATKMMSVFVCYWIVLAV